MVENATPDDRCACPWCGEDVRRTARICPRCDRPPLWTLAVNDDVDSRTAYRAARALEGVTDVPFLELKRCLDDAPGIILSNVVRETADRVAARLAADDVSAKITPAAEDETPSARQRPRSFNLRSPLVLAIAAILTVAAGLVTRSWLSPAGSRPSRPLQSEDVGPLIESSAVQLKCDSSLGTGFFVEPDLIVTNDHVLCDGDTIEVTTLQGEVYAGRAVYRDPRHDLALVRVPDADAVPLTLGDASSLDRGDPVYTIGNPHGLDFTLSKGIVSHPDRVILGVSCVQIDGSIHPGNSGGALVDQYGRAIAVVSMRFREQSDLGFAVPVNYLFGVTAELTPTEPWFDPIIWDKRISEARDRELAELEKIREQAGQPFLTMAGFQPPGAIVAVVGKTGDTAPIDDGFAFRVVRGDAILCRPTGSVTTWQRGSSNGDEASSRFVRWLEANDIDTQMWFAPIVLEMAGCPAPDEILGAELELEGAFASGSRARIEARGW